MATKAQNADADRFANGLRNVVQSYKDTHESFTRINNYWNSRTEPQKNEICTLKNLDRLEVGSIISNLSTIGTTVVLLPRVDASF